MCTAKVTFEVDRMLKEVEGLLYVPARAWAIHAGMVRLLNGKR